MRCWYCHWGWSKAVVQIYKKYINEAGESAMHYGAAHIVWDDENFERHHVQWCLDNFEEYKHKEASDAENEAVKQSIIELLELPDELLDPEPQSYKDADEDADPQDYPPTVGMDRIWQLN